jgi:hypothetical protein
LPHHTRITDRRLVARAVTSITCVQDVLLEEAPSVGGPPGVVEAPLEGTEGATEDPEGFWEGLEGFPEDLDETLGEGAVVPAQEALSEQPAAAGSSPNDQV